MSQKPYVHIWAYKLKFDSYWPINLSHINIFERDQLNTKGMPKLHVLCNL